MRITSLTEGLTLPVDTDFFYMTNTGHVFARYKSSDGALVFTDVIGEQFAASLAAVNMKNDRVVTNSDIDDIINQVYNQAIAKAGNLKIEPACYKTPKASKKKVS